MSSDTREPTWQQISNLFDVPPWLANPNYPAPRFARLRWKLRRVWKLPERDVPGPPSYFEAMERAQRLAIDKMLYGYAYIGPDGERISFDTRPLIEPEEH